MLYDNVTKISTHVKLGSSHEACSVCKDDYVIEHHCHPYEARRALEGKFLGQKLISVSDALICEECMKKLYCSIAENGEVIRAFVDVSYEELVDSAQKTSPARHESKE